MYKETVEHSRGNEDGLCACAYLCVARLAELLDLACGDVTVLVALPALVVGQASTDAALPGG